MYGRIAEKSMFLAKHTPSAGTPFTSCAARITSRRWAFVWCVAAKLDVNDARKVAVVNQTIVNRYFGPVDQIGRHVKLTMLESLPNGAVENQDSRSLG